MKYLRLLLFPFSLLYGLIVIIRNRCYDLGIFRSTQFGIPVISVGNLDVGGAGKTPMTEYLIRLLKNDYHPATLSRGYGRKTTGYVESCKLKVESETQLTTHNPQLTAHNLQPTTHFSQPTTVDAIGDEPAQFAQKFPDITVAVCEDRVAGINRLKDSHDLIILDDAYQHRAVKPGLSLLLFDYSRVNEPHLLLPAGNLREPFSGRKRADDIVITKCPAELSTHEQAAVLSRIQPLPNQQVFFSSITYLPLQDMDGNPSDAKITSGTTVFLLTGIANASPLLQHLEKRTAQIAHHNYPDHHRFSLKNITKLAAAFSACESKDKLLLTTEKDAQRLAVPELLPLVKQLPVVVLPIGVSFLNGTQQQFNQFIVNYVREHTKHCPIH